MADFLAHAGIPTWIDAQHRIAHNKIMVIDGAVVITGAFNFTKGPSMTTPRTCSSFEARLWLPSTPGTGRLTPGTPSRMRAGGADPYPVGHTVSIREPGDPTGRDLLPKLDADSLKKAVASELWPRN